MKAQTSGDALYHGLTFTDCGNSAAESSRKTTKNRVTVTVRQDGREIVCTLSAVTVFFIFREFFITGQKLSCLRGLMGTNFWKGEENLHL